MNSVELKYPVTIVEGDVKKEVKYLTPTRLKVKHLDLLPTSLMQQAQENSEAGDDEKFKLKLTTKELIPMFSELKPFLASVFNQTIEVIDDIDFEDIENVIGALEQVFPEDQKKN